MIKRVKVGSLGKAGKRSGDEDFMRFSLSVFHYIYAYVCE